MEQWLGNESIERRSNLSLEEFENEYNSQYKPVIITDLTQNWPCQKIWTLENLVRWVNFHFSFDYLLSEPKIY